MNTAEKFLDVGFCGHSVSKCKCKPCCRVNNEHRLTSTLVIRKTDDLLLHLKCLQLTDWTLHQEICRPRCRVHDVGYTMQGTQCRVHDVGYTMQGTKNIGEQHGLICLVMWYFSRRIRRFVFAQLSNRFSYCPSLIVLAFFNTQKHTTWAVISLHHPLAIMLPIPRQTLHIPVAKSQLCLLKQGISKDNNYCYLSN